MPAARRPHRGPPAAAVAPPRPGSILLRGTLLRWPGECRSASVFGNTKLARADAIRQPEPSMLIHAIYQGRNRRRGARLGPKSRRRSPRGTGSSRRCRAARRAYPSAAVRLWAVSANVLMLKKSVSRELRGRRQPSSCYQAARPRHHRTRVCWRCSSSSVIPGLWPVPAAGVRRRGEEDGSHEEGNGVRSRPYRARTRGSHPGRSREAPSMNSQAMAELRRAGFTRMLRCWNALPRIDPGHPICAGKYRCVPPASRGDLLRLSCTSCSSVLG